MAYRPLVKIYKKKSLPGFFLIFFGCIALIIRNSNWGYLYNNFINYHVDFLVIGLNIQEPVIFFVNEALMTLFFLTVGLEIKREILHGSLSTTKKMLLPGIAAIGGVTLPALIYLAVNNGDNFAMHGWAIPTATDIAFASGTLLLFGKRVPPSLKIILLTIAILDDLIAIVIIAIFYSSHINFGSLLLAAGFIATLIWLNKKHGTKIWMYWLIGTSLWVALEQSGIHATITGALLAFFTPLRFGKMLHLYLYPWVYYFILPAFAFCNAGIDLTGVSINNIWDPVPLGIWLGLFIGKQCGVFSFSWLGIKLGIIKKPRDITWAQLYGVAVLCGIGFTMSIFIGNLSFGESSEYLQTTSKLGTLYGSIISALFAYLVLNRSLPRKI